MVASGQIPLAANRYRIEHRGHPETPGFNVSYTWSLCDPDGEFVDEYDTKREALAAVAAKVKRQRIERESPLQRMLLQVEASMAAGVICVDMRLIREQIRGAVSPHPGGRPIGRRG